MQVQMAKTVTHAPRTNYNQQMWAAVQGCKGIKAGVPMATLHAHVMATVPHQSAHHVTAHIKYLLRSKGALVAKAA